MATATLNRPFRMATVLILCLLCQPVFPQQNTVLGERNADLSKGVDALLAGDAAEGVRLTLLGMRHAHNSADKLTGLSNLCAGYVMLEQFDDALEYCDRAIELNNQHWHALSNRALVYINHGRYEDAEQDIQRGLELAPSSRTLQRVNIMLQDAMNPVSPNVSIDDGRQPVRANDE